MPNQRLDHNSINLTYGHPDGVPNEYIIYRNALGQRRLVNPDSGASKYDPEEITVDTIYAPGRFDTIGTKLTPTDHA